MITDITKKMGHEGFVWFFGVVEDISDPLELGRARVRITGVHSQSKAKVPTEDLPWAVVIQSIASSALNGVGISPNGLLVGTHVFGFFRDGNSKQQPILLGTVAGIAENNLDMHDVSPQARGKDTRKRNPFGPEPHSGFKSKYPHNKTITTTSGHILELDDTPGNERINIQHKSGSYFEVLANGDFITKSITNKYDIIVSNNEMYVGGNLNITCLNDVNITAKTITITETD